MIPSVVQELKFVIPALSASALTAGLEGLLLPDSQHPQNDVITVYFDTRDLRALREKLDGESVKSKVRLRWYEVGGAAVATGPAFLEVKEREGGVRWKRRVEVPLDIAPWRARPLEHPAWIDLPRRLAPTHFEVEPGLRPTAAVRYRRRRFVERATGSRVAFDAGIHATACHRGLLPGVVPVRLREGILEVKTSAELPPALAFLIAAAGGRRQAVSKYAACLGLHGGL